MYYHDCFQINTQTGFSHTTKTKTKSNQSAPKTDLRMRNIVQQ